MVVASPFGAGRSRGATDRRSSFAKPDPQGDPIPLRFAGGILAALARFAARLQLRLFRESGRDHRRSTGGEARSDLSQTAAPAWGTVSRYGLRLGRVDLPRGQTLWSKGPRGDVE